jgi:hypothetical protein
MALRYYPKSKIKTNLIAENTQFLLDGNPYIGKYYETFDGRYFTGPNPVLGDNKELIKVDIYNSTPGLNFMPMTSNFRTTLASKNKTINRPTGKPTSYFPVPTEDEYRKGYFTLYFKYISFDNSIIFYNYRVCQRSCMAFIVIKY